jgi:serine protease inhibitor
MQTHSQWAAAANWAAAAVLAAAAALCGCGGGEVNPTPNAPPGSSSSQPVSGSSAPAAVVQAAKDRTPVDPAIVAADNAFGLNLLNTLLPGSTGNVAISPISVAMALQIVYNGAGGSTQQGMARTLGLGNLSSSALNADNAALQASLMSVDPLVRITIANSLWMHLSDNRVLASFTKTDETYYGATLGDLAGAPDNVNAWIAGETHGLITDILPQEPPGLYAKALAVIANAIYFKGQWSTTFDPAATTTAPFSSGSTQVSAEMMHQTGSFDYLEGTLQGSHFQAVRLPYGAGRLDMLIVLPDSATPLASFVAAVTAAELRSWSGEFQNAMGSIALPRFNATYGKSLPEALTALGMGAAFCASGEADFPGLATGDPPPCIADVEHKTVVEVDESGTIAAGATTVTIGTYSVVAPQFSMTMDHPFFYAIEDAKSGELLFVGILVNPG